jgi:predicted esterase
MRSTASPCAASKTPILFYHSTNDELAPIGEMQQLAARFCGEGVTVHIETSPVGEHISYVLVGFPTALDYIADRFAGQPAPDDCQSTGGAT